MKTLYSFSELANERKQITGKLGLVPTMGALHDGHLSLVEKIRPLVNKVMVSIFVNPLQFGANEDLSKYPRTIAADLEKLKNVDYAYLPQGKDIYPHGEKITIHAGKAAEGLESDFRPGHFDGVCTVVDILFTQTLPDFTIFGEKDYQQLMVIEEMMENRKSPIILSAPTLREPDGLAMSSRNTYLSPEERKTAPLLYKTLKSVTGNRQSAIKTLEAAGFKPQYVTERWGRLLAAVYLGKTRLIDNVPLPN